MINATIFVPHKNRLLFIREMKHNKHRFNYAGLSSVSFYYTVCMTREDLHKMTLLTFCTWYSKEDLHQQATARQTNPVRTIE